MTVLCGGGASAAKAGVAETIIFTAGSLSSLLNNKGGYWATLAAPLLGVLAYSATDLCTVDPPAQPTITDAEYTALLQLGPWDELSSALLKLTDIVKRIVWYDMCACVSGTTPSLPPATLALPTGVTLPTYGGGALCPQPRIRITQPDAASAGWLAWHNITRQFFPGLPIYEAAVVSTPLPVDAGNDCIQTPCSWGAFTSRVQLVSGNAPTTQGYGYAISCLNASRQLTSTLFANGVNNAAPLQTGSGTFDCNACRYLMVHHGATTQVVGTGQIDVEMNITCSGAGLPASECCSDPAAIAIMGQLLQQVTLIQRQSVPFAYVPGIVHAGLTGTGELAVQGLIGALVQITGGLSGIGTESGTPDQTFEAGWITWGNADGFSSREWITNASLVSLPALCGQYTRIGYTLTAGMTVTITELVREP